jgi:hypothetical protein
VLSFFLDTSEANGIIVWYLSFVGTGKVNKEFK